MHNATVVQKSPLTFRLSEEQVARLDALVVALSERAAGLELTRAGVARLVVERGLLALESELSKPKKGSK